MAGWDKLIKFRQITRSGDTRKVERSLARVMSAIVVKYGGVVFKTTGIIKPVRYPKESYYTTKYESGFVAHPEFGVLRVNILMAPLISPYFGT